MAASHLHTYTCICMMYRNIINTVHIYTYKIKCNKKNTERIKIILVTFRIRSECSDKQALL